MKEKFSVSISAQKITLARNKGQGIETWSLGYLDIKHQGYISNMVLIFQHVLGKDPEN